MSPFRARRHVAPARWLWIALAVVAIPTASWSENKKNAPPQHAPQQHAPQQHAPQQQRTAPAAHGAPSAPQQQHGGAAQQGTRPSMPVQAGHGGSDQHAAPHWAAPQQQTGQQQTGQQRTGQQQRFTGTRPVTPSQSGQQNRATSPAMPQGGVKSDHAARVNGENSHGRTPPQATNPNGREKTQPPRADGAHGPRIGSESAPKNDPPTAPRGRDGGRPRVTSAPSNPGRHAAAPDHPQAAKSPFVPPKGAVQKPDGRGGTTYTVKGGTQFHTGQNGHLTALNTRNGARAKFGQNGHVAAIHTGNMTISRGANGARRVETRLNDGARVVNTGRARGFVDRSFVRGSQSYVTRTYVHSERVSSVVYRTYEYRGVRYYGYVPAVYYAPAFYTWAYDPWPAPVAWQWGWAREPWYGYYGAYFAPYPTYPYPALWITDFVLAENLRAAYDAGAAAATAEQPAPQSDVSYLERSQPVDAGKQDPASRKEASQPPPQPPRQKTALTPETKKAIADEVKAQLAAERTAAESSPSAPTEQRPEILERNVRTFIVSTVLRQQQDDGTECALSPGDVLTRIGNTADAQNNVHVVVNTGQANDCEPGAQLTMSLQALQDMHNDFREKVDAGLQNLAADQGKNGMTTGPAADPKPLPEGQGQPDVDAAKQIAQLERDAAKTEADVDEAQKESGGELLSARDQ